MSQAVPPYGETQGRDAELEQRSRAAIAAGEDAVSVDPYALLSLIARLVTFRTLSERTEVGDRGDER